MPEAKAVRTGFEHANPILNVANMARSLRYYVDVLGFSNTEEVMALFVDGLSCEVVPKQNPGERTGICHEGYRFIYMTGSGAWSRLLEPGTVQALIGEAESRIPVGYNQLWVFEKKFCATPDLGEARPCQRLDEERKQYPRELGRHLWPGQLYVVLQDPEWAQRGPVPLTYHTKLDEAILYAQLQADQLKVRTIVGLMLADVTWH